MCSHEMKYCPHCNNQFECKVGSILLCQCAAVDISDDERDYISRQFDDCLCSACMIDLKSEFRQKEFNASLGNLLRR